MSGIFCRLKYRAKRPVRETEDWMKANCTGAWKLNSDEIDESDPARIVYVLAIDFEKMEDRDKFQTSFGKGE